MDIEKIIETLEDNLYEPNTDEKVSIIDFYNAFLCIKCNGEYDFYKYEEQPVEYTDSEGRKYTNYKTIEIYYEPFRDVIYAPENEKTTFITAFRYDEDEDILVEDEYGDHEINDRDIINYYKCCKADRPYFKDIKLENGISIDAFANIYLNGEKLCSLKEMEQFFLPFLSTYNPFGNRVIKLLGARTIDFNSLPEIYKNYMLENGIKLGRNK